MSTDPRTDPRRAGEVTRYHTWSRIREQSVGEHSWQVLRVLLALWPNAPRHLLVHAVTHDVGELTTGDLPYPVKANSPTLRAIVDQLERDAHLAMATPWNLPSPFLLSHFEHQMFKLAEFVEMWEWALAEVEMGNRRAALVASRCRDAIVILRNRVLHDCVNEDEPTPNTLTRNLDQYVQRRVATHDQTMEETTT